MFIPARCLAQQNPQFGLFQIDKYRVNPAFAGMDNRLSLTASYRNQWQGLIGNPESMNVSAHIPLYSINGATGLQIGREAIGAMDDIRFSASYNQVLRFDFGLLSMSAKAGLLNKRINGNEFKSSSGYYEMGVFDHQDDFIPEGLISGITAVWGIGMYFVRDDFDFGIVFDETKVTKVSIGPLSIQKRPSITIHGNYFLNLSTVLRLEFFGLLRSDFIQWQTEVGVLGRLYKNVFTSVQFRGYNQNTFDAIAFGLGAKLNDNLLLAYQYDFTISSLRQVSNGTHEMLIRYLVDVNLGKKIPEKIIHSPRLYE
jgi:type IX secretion system PorP/SprF family membrane protein